MLERIFYIVIIALIGARARRAARDPGNPLSGPQLQNPDTTRTTLPALDPAALAEDERRALRRLRADGRSRLLGVLGAAAAALTGLAYAAWLLDTEDDAPRESVPFDTHTWWQQLQDLVGGRFAPPAVMTFALAVMGLTMSATIALAIGKDTPSETRTQLGQMLWRRGVMRALFPAVTAAVVLGVVGWIGMAGRDGSGYLIIADVAAAVAVLLVMAIQTEISDAARKLGEADTLVELQGITERRTHLPAASSGDGKWWQKTRARRVLLAYLPRVTAAAVTGVLTIAAVQVVVGALTDDMPHFARAQVGDVLALIVLQACMFLAQAAPVFLAWTRSERGWSRRSDLILGGVARVLILTTTAFYAVGGVADQPVTAAGFCVAWTLNPAVMWCIIAWTRTHQRPAVLTWVTAPLWTAIGRSLDATQHRLERQLSELRTR